MASPRYDSRHGKMKPGWTRQGLQVPTSIRERFASTTSKEGQASIRNAGTAAMAIYLGVPSDVRMLFNLWLGQQIAFDPNSVTPEECWKVFLEIVEACRDGGDKDTPKWFMDRILDPELLGKKKQHRDRKRA
jgi:hypothetical protein